MQISISNEVERWAQSRLTSNEIALAIHELFPGEEQFAWETPKGDPDSELIIKRAWELADSGEDTLHWGL